MLRHSLLFLFLFLNIRTVDANLDSLHQVFHQSIGVEKLSTSLELSKGYTYLNLDSANHYVDISLHLHDSLINTTDMTPFTHKLWYRKGMIYHGYNKPDKSKAYYEKAISICPENQKKERQEIQLNYIALLMQINDESVLDKLKKLHSELLESSDTDEQMLYYVSYIYSRAYDNINELDSAVSILVNMLDEVDTQFEREEKSGVLNSLAMYYERMNNYEEATRYFNMAIHDPYVKDYEKSQIILNNAKAHYRLGRQDSVLLYLEMLENIEGHVGNVERFEALLLESKIERSAGNFNKYRGLLYRAEKIADEMNDLVSHRKIWLELAKLHIDIQKYNTAKSLLSKYEKSIKIKSKLPIESRLDLVRLQNEVSLGKHVGPYGLKQFEEYRMLRDSMQEMIGENRVSEIVEKYQHEKADLENEKLRQEKQFDKQEIIAKNRFLKGGGVALGLLGLLSMLLYRQKSKQELLNEALAIQKDKILLLNKEINHRVKNNLSFMTSLLAMQGRRTEAKEAKVILKESENRFMALSLVHTNLNKKEDSSIELGEYLADIIKHLETIFQLPDKELLFESNFTSHMIGAEDAMRIGLIINELVTNSIKHVDQDTIKVSVNTYFDKENNLKLLYQDNGEGIEKHLASPDTQTNMGLQLIKLLRKQLAHKVDVIIV